jgi:hypothetical protein
MSIDITTVEVAMINVKKPKKYEALYVSKFQYDEAKFDIMFKSVEVLDIKRPSSHDTFIYIKLDRKQIEGILKIEEAVIDHTVKNVESWFKQKMNTSLIEDYFEKNIIVDKKFGKVFKCKVSNNDVAIDISNTRVDIVLRASALRFSKQKYAISWQLQNTCPSFYFDDNDNSTDDDADLNDIACIVNAAQENLEERLNEMGPIIENDMAMVKQRHDTYNVAKSMFETMIQDKKDLSYILECIEKINDMLLGV